jgi:NAD(P)-dependent dehydrogenase (short-subunit alcohol dehydrogenase family)
MHAVRDLDERVVIVAGIGPGLGRSTALACAQAGARVVVSARTTATVDALVGELQSLHPTRSPVAVGVVGDVCVPADRQSLIDRALRAFGRIDGLVNNAFAMGPMEAIARVSSDAWRAVFEVNVFATIALSSEVAPHMIAGGGGAIVMINSQAARRAAVRRGPYAASKAALLVAAQVLAAELGPDGVRVNSVVPGQIWGESLAAHYEGVAQRRGVDAAEVLAQVTREIPLRRISTADEIAEAVVFLLSARASAITGQSLDVNAGNWFH